MTPENIKFMQQPEVQAFFQELIDSSKRNTADMKRQLAELEEELMLESKKFIINFCK